MWPELHPLDQRPRGSGGKRGMGGGGALLGMTQDQGPGLGKDTVKSGRGQGLPLMLHFVPNPYDALSLSIPAHPLPHPLQGGHWAPPSGVQRNKLSDPLPPSPINRVSILPRASPPALWHSRLGRGLGRYIHSCPGGRWRVGLSGSHGPRTGALCCPGSAPPCPCQAAWAACRGVQGSLGCPACWEARC